MLVLIHHSTWLHAPVAWNVRTWNLQVLFEVLAFWDVVQNCLVVCYRYFGTEGSDIFEDGTNTLSQNDGNKLATSRNIPE